MNANLNNAFDWMKSGMLTEDDRQAVAQNAELNEAARLASIEEAKLFHDVFANGRGPELLELLRNLTIEVPLMDVSRSFVRGEVALAPADWAYVREGQNSVIRMIEEQIRIARTPEPLPAQQRVNDDD